MEELNKEYIILFNAITDALEQLQQAQQLLIQAQQHTEERYISQGETANHSSAHLRLPNT